MLDLTPLTGAEAAETRTVPVDRFELNYRLVQVGLATFPAGLIVGLAVSSFTGWFGIVTGFLVWVGLVAVLTMRTRHGLKQRVWAAGVDNLKARKSENKVIMLGVTNMSTPRICWIRTGWRLV